MTTLTIISGGLREPSSTRLLAERLEASVRVELAALDLPATSSFVDLRHLGRPIMDAMLTGFASAELESTYETVAGADGIIAVTPAFNASFSGLFKSFFDVLDKEAIEGLPVVIAATAGTPRHSLALDYAIRPMFMYLHAVVVPTAVFAASEDWGSGADTVKTLPDRITRAAGELAPLVAASERSRQVRDPFVVTSDLSPVGGFQPE
jgi:FMN reductase